MKKNQVKRMCGFLSCSPFFDECPTCIVHPLLQFLLTEIRQYWESWIYRTPSRERENEVLEKRTKKERKAGRKKMRKKRGEL